MLTPEAALEKREFMLREGYVLIEDVLPEALLEELRAETERLIADHVEAHEVRYQGQLIDVHAVDNAIIDKLLTWKPTYEALAALGFGDFNPEGKIIILTKEAGGPPLYWHQDWIFWDDPLSLSPWPQVFALNYYLTDTTVENGCLKVIPGSHRKRFPIHDRMVQAHEQGARFVSEDDPVMFSTDPDQVYLPVKAGDLVLLDARTLHAAERNQTDKRRILVLAWHVRPWDTIPDFWQGEIPEAIAERDPEFDYKGSRTPREFLKS